MKSNPTLAQKIVKMFPSKKNKHWKKIVQRNFWIKPLQTGKWKTYFIGADAAFGKDSVGVTVMRRNSDGAIVDITK
tara:strand:+ start:598 stop:825 length:228 start_codon:yes stop_codon:yes gene_type:complete